jgi:pyrrolidone-carboxylate peptidase
VFYHLMRKAALVRRGHRIRCAGFVHVPALPAAHAHSALAGYARALQIVLLAAQRSIL